MKKYCALLAVVLCTIVAIGDGQDQPKAKGDGRLWEQELKFFLNESLSIKPPILLHNSRLTCHESKSSNLLIVAIGVCFIGITNKRNNL